MMELAAGMVCVAMVVTIVCLFAEKIVPGLAKHNSCRMPHTECCHKLPIVR
jgi:hypothetical protein